MQPPCDVQICCLSLSMNKAEARAQEIAQNDRKRLFDTATLQCGASDTSQREPSCTGAHSMRPSSARHDGTAHSLCASDTPRPTTPHDADSDAFTLAGAAASRSVRSRPSDSVLSLSSDSETLPSSSAKAAYVGSARRYCMMPLHACACDGHPSRIKGAACMWLCACDLLLTLSVTRGPWPDTTMVVILAGAIA